MLSIVMPVFGNVNLLTYSIPALIREAPEGSDLVIVDDGSPAETESFLRSLTGIRVVRHKFNRGTAASMNTGFASARGDVVIFINSDVLATTETFELLVGVAKQPDTGVAGAVLIYPSDGSIQHCGVAIDRAILSHVYKYRLLRDLGGEDIQPRLAVTAALMACRREMFDQLGGFDTSFRDGLEDIDFCLKASRAGYINRVIKRAVAFHIESATRGGRKHVRRTYNYATFFGRWGTSVASDLTSYFSHDIDRLAAQLPRNATLINFCTTPNWTEYVDAVLPLYSVNDLLDCSGDIEHCTRIDLFCSIPAQFRQSPAPLVFVTDEFRQLRSNREWFAPRQQVDFIIDRNANVLAWHEVPR